MTPSNKILDDECTDKFLCLMKRKGLEYKKATTWQDYNEHWDYYIPSLKMFVDIKNKNSHKYGKTYIELANGSGDMGWLKGKATHIAFLFPDGFYFFEREYLLNWALENKNRFKMCSPRPNKPKELIFSVQLNILKEELKGHWFTPKKDENSCQQN